MAIDAIAFLDAMEFVEVDLLGFSIGSFVAQEIALIRPAVVRRLVLASSAPQGAAGMHGWDSEVIEAVGGRAPNPEGYLSVFFTESSASRQSGVEALGRITARSEDRDQPTTWQTRHAQYDAVCAWGIPDHGLLQRLEAIDVPVFVANGDSDPMILPHYLVSARRPDPASAGEDLPGRGARIPLPAPRRVRRRCRDIPEHDALTTAPNGATA